MSSTIKNQESLNARALQSTERRHKRDLQNIDNSYEALKTDLKKTQALDLVDIQHEHLRTIGNEQAKKEKVLAEMKGQLELTAKMTDKELSDLKKNSEVQKANLAENLSVDRERQISMHEVHLEDENARYNSAIRNVREEGNGQLSDAKIKMNEEVQEVDSAHQNKLRTKKNEFSEKFKDDEIAYDRMKTGQEQQYAYARQKTNLTQQRELSKLTDAHAKHLETEETNYRTAYKGQDLQFEKKFENQLQVHDKSYQDLKAKNDSLLNDLKQSLTTSIAVVSEKNDDPFYRFETISPKLKQFEDRIEITVEVPEHAKKDVLLTTNGKEAIISFNRRFQDASRSPAGVINKVSKVESFTTRIPTESILNPKSVKSQYEDGVMTFTVKKA